jgi:hypothetical protein
LLSCYTNDEISRVFSEGSKPFGSPDVFDTTNTRGELRSLCLGLSTSSETLFRELVSTDYSTTEAKDILPDRFELTKATSSCASKFRRC